MTMSSVFWTLVGEVFDVYEERDALRERVIDMQAHRHNNAPKLGKGEVTKIHEMRRAGYTVQEIADSFDVNKSTVSRTLKGVYHK
jgi:membrane-bound ClpP family serine protease